MFKNKGVKTIKKPYVVKLKVVNPSFHMVDANITKSKITEEQVFKNKKPIRKKFIAI